MSNQCSIIAGQSGLILKTPYKPDLVNDLKMSIPSTDRKFDPTSKTWVVSPAYGQTLVKMVMQHFGEMVQLPQLSQKTTVATKLLEVRYVGQCKLREDGTTSAFGWVSGEWSVIFSEQALRDWFEAGPAPVQSPDVASTLYAILGVSKQASEDDIKTAFRKMARMWHPDVCKEPNAHEMFIRIEEARTILSDPRKRAKYDAGLALEASLGHHHQPNNTHQFAAGGYRPPLRCGLIMATGHESIGRFVVEKIIAWEEISQGNKTLVTSWPMGAKRPMEVWA